MFHLSRLTPNPHKAFPPVEVIHACPALRGITPPGGIPRSKVCLDHLSLALNRAIQFLFLCHCEERSLSDEAISFFLRIWLPYGCLFLEL